MKQAYAQDPTNTELSTLKAELEDLIKLTKELVQQQQQQSQPKASRSKDKQPEAAAAAAPQDSNSNNNNKRKASAPVASTSSAASASASSAPLPSASLKSGDECLAKYSADQKYYPARIVSISGSADKARFSVIFKGYENTELISAHDIKPLSQEKKRQLQESQEEEADKEKRRKKNLKKEETKAAKNKEQTSKQSAWQSFAKKGTKKGIHIPGVQGESMFASPDNPYGRGQSASLLTLFFIFFIGLLT